MEFSSGAGRQAPGGAAPGVLRLLPHVHHPPARVVVFGASAGPEARALHARGYAVVELRAGDDPLELDLAGSFDLVCERGWWATLHPSRRDAYVLSAARALRSGGQLFGVFPLPGEGPPHGVSTSELLHRFAPWFEAARLEPGAFPFAGTDRPELEVVLVRR